MSTDIVTVRHRRERWWQSLEWTRRKGRDAVGKVDRSLGGRMGCMWNGFAGVNTGGSIQSRQDCVEQNKYSS